MKRILTVTSFLALSLHAHEASGLLAMNATEKAMLFLGFLAIGIGILSSGYALSISLGAYAACKKEERAHAFIPSVMPGSQGIYSFAICFLMIQNMSSMPIKTAIAGIICGLPCLFSALGQAKTAACCIKSISNKEMDQGQALLATGVPELYALCGLAAAFLVMI